MSFSNIIFKSTNVTVREELKDFVAQKLISLEKYIGDETDVKCEFEFEKVAPHKSGDIFRVEANLWVAGTLYRAEATKINFEAAVDVVRDELDAELAKDTQKRQTLVRKGGREIKEVLRFGQEK